MVLVVIYISFSAILNFLERKAQVPKTTIVVASLFAVFASLYLTLGPDLVCNLVGYVYPVYASFKAIESSRKDDDTQWLTYWVVFATMSVLETFADILLYLFPFYYSFKFGFLIWLFLPETRGAIFLHKHFISPVFLKSAHYFGVLEEEEEVIAELAEESKE